MTRTQKLIWLIASALMVLYVSMYSASFADIGKSLEKAQSSENLQHLQRSRDQHRYESPHLRG
jgi:hypothetical protein